jgi:hypothetical protein
MRFKMTCSHGCEITARNTVAGSRRLTCASDFIPTAKRVGTAGDKAYGWVPEWRHFRDTAI